MKKKRTPLTRKRVLTDPVFELTRQNNTEFSRAGTANRVLHHAFIPGLRNTAHRYETLYDGFNQKETGQAKEDFDLFCFVIRVGLFSNHLRGDLMALYALKLLIFR